MMEASVQKSGDLSEMEKNVQKKEGKKTPPKPVKSANGGGNAKEMEKNLKNLSSKSNFVSTTFFEVTGALFYNPRPTDVGKALHHEVVLKNNHPERSTSFKLFPPSAGARLEIKIGKVGGKINPGKEVKIPIVIVAKKVGELKARIVCKVGFLREAISLDILLMAKPQEIQVLDPCVDLGLVELGEVCDFTVPIRNGSTTELSFRVFNRGDLEDRERAQWLGINPAIGTLQKNETLLVNFSVKILKTGIFDTHVSFSSMDGVEEATRSIQVFGVVQKARVVCSPVVLDFKEVDFPKGEEEGEKVEKETKKTAESTKGELLSQPTCNFPKLSFMMMNMTALPTEYFIFEEMLKKFEEFTVIISSPDGFHGILPPCEVGKGGKAKASETPVEIRIIPKQLGEKKSFEMVLPIFYANNEARARNAIRKFGLMNAGGKGGGAIERVTKMEHFKYYTGVKLKVNAKE